MSLSTISVIVPVYKVEPYLDRCVESIVSQSFRDLEILLVDDGSPDRCGIMCDSWTKRDNRIRSLHKENGGLSDARNYGFEHSSGEYVIFIDSDDYIESKMLETLYDLITTTNADIAICGAYDCYEDRKTWPKQEIRQFTCDGTQALQITLKGGVVPGGIWTKLIRRSIIGEHRFLKGKTYEDAFFTPQLFKNAHKVAITTEPFYNYWHRADSITTEPFCARAMDIIEAYSFNADFIQKNHPELLDLALFRIQWAHFIVLDRILLMKDYKKIPQYRPVLEFLKTQWYSIWRCPYFAKGRRIAALALRMNVKLYKILSDFNKRKTRSN